MSSYLEDEFIHPEWTPKERQENFERLMTRTVNFMLKDPDRYGRKAFRFIRTDNGGNEHYYDIDGNYLGPVKSGSSD